MPKQNNCICVISQQTDTFFLAVKSRFFFYEFIDKKFLILQWIFVLHYIGQG